MIFILRRFLLVLVATLTKDILFVQVSSMVFISIAQVAYLSYFNPIQNPLILKLDIFNEVTTVILVDVLTVFTDGNPHEPSVVMDIIFLVVLFGNISVHLYFLVKDTCYQTKLKCKRKGGCCCCCKP